MSTGPNATTGSLTGGSLAGMGSLLDDPSLDPARMPGGKAGAKGGTRRKARTQRDKEPVQATVRRWWDGGRNRYKGSKRFRVATWIVAAVIVGGGGPGLYLWLRPTPVPDYASAPLGKVLDFTFLTNEFNKLPVEQRIKLIGDLVSRVKGMDGRESVLMAAFAAGISGKAREQLEENASRLMLDMMDNFAAGYKNVPAGEEEEFIESKVVDMVRMMSQIGGEENTQTDEEILSDARQQAERDQRFMQSGNMTGNMAGRMFTTINNGIGAHSSPHQRARVGMFLRDMTRHLRGQDVKTGKPLPPGESQPPPSGPG